jgi:hypothetical protein
VRFFTAIVFAIVVAAPAQGLTLRGAYESAGPGSGYDREVVLQAGQVYTGGLLIGPVYSPMTWEMEGEPGEDVRIVGNGAVLDLEGQQICISFCENRLDIEDCVILNGCIRFRGINTASYVLIPEGSVSYCTFYRPHDYGVRLQGAGGGVTLERNIVVDAVDTGYDFLYTHGSSNEWLPTGASFAPSIQPGYYGTPIIRQNWTYHSDPTANADPLRHFCYLCEYG